MHSYNKAPRDAPRALEAMSLLACADIVLPHAAFMHEHTWPALFAAARVCRDLYAVFRQNAAYILRKYVQTRTLEDLDGILANAVALDSTTGSEHADMLWAELERQGLCARFLGICTTYPVCLVVFGQDEKFASICGSVSVDALVTGLSVMRSDAGTAFERGLVALRGAVSNLDDRVRQHVVAMVFLLSTLTDQEYTRHVPAYCGCAFDAPALCFALAQCAAYQTHRCNVLRASARNVTLMFEHLGVSALWSTEAGRAALTAAARLSDLNLFQACLRFSGAHECARTRAEMTATLTAMGQHGALGLVLATHKVCS